MWANLNYNLSNKITTIAIKHQETVRKIPYEKQIIIGANVKEVVEALTAESIKQGLKIGLALGASLFQPLFGFYVTKVFI